MTIEIRAAREDEAGAVARVHVEADRQTYKPLFGAAFRAVPLAESEARWREALARGDAIVVALEGERIAGFGCLSGDWLSALYLLAPYRRRGLGARLLALLCVPLAERGFAEVRFTAVAANADAIAFYEALGAEVVGEVTEGEGEEDWRDLVFRLPTDGPAAFLAARGRCIE